MVGGRPEIVNCGSSSRISFVFLLIPRLLCVYQPPIFFVDMFGVGDNPCRREKKIFAFLSRLF